MSAGSWKPGVANNSKCVSTDIASASKKILRIRDDVFNLETAVGRARRYVRARSDVTQKVNANEGGTLSIHAALMREMSGLLRFLGSRR
ncbi:hypothetical protein SFPGR_33300 [Sulfuriferula plumbiphila]|nr:hypothetical protein SFPGR_33300 [Sulfuriferula plumbiphila]